MRRIRIFSTVLRLSCGWRQTLVRDILEIFNGSLEMNLNRAQHGCGDHICCDKQSDQRAIGILPVYCATSSRAIYGRKPVQLGDR